MAILPEVAVAGEIFVDLIFSGLDAWPEPGKEIFARSFHRDVGGGTAITACALSTFGTSCAIFACIGEDAGDWITERLRGFGVETDTLYLEAAEPTAITVAATQPHERAFLTYAGANQFFEARFAAAVRSGTRVAGRHVHLAYAPEIGMAAEVLDELHAQGCSVSLDVGWREGWLSDSRAVEVLRKVDIFFPNEAEAARMSHLQDAKAMLEWFAGRGIERVVLKLGAKGAAMLWDGRIEFANGCRATAIDTTGAGDCFNAGFLNAWLKGRDPQACLHAANLCGALSTESIGGLNALGSTSWRKMIRAKEAE